MSEIYVQSSEALSDVIQELSTLDQQFMDQVSALDREQANLVQAWEGEASQAFQERYRRERDYFCAFATVVSEYINGLSQILATYEQAEANNVAIAGDGLGLVSHLPNMQVIFEQVQQLQIQLAYGMPTSILNGTGIDVGAALNSFDGVAHSGGGGSHAGSSGIGHSGAGGHF